MQKTDKGVLYSASDLVNFLDCEHLTELDRQHLDTPQEKAEDDEQTMLLRSKGFTHEKKFADLLKSRHSSFVDIVTHVGKDYDKRVQATIDALKEGVNVIYQATFRDGDFIGHADFLLKVDISSNLGNHSYEVIDTKLARSTKAKFIIQLAFYSDLLGKAQGVPPRMMHVVLGDMSEANYRVADYAHYFARLKNRFIDRLNNPVATYPTPCARCDICHWRERCEKRLIDDDHLSLVANINRTQIKKLEAAGVSTLAALANLKQPVPKINKPILDRLCHQAALQFKARKTGQPIVELISESDEPCAGPKGFKRLPQPNDGDMFFDMEGNPMEDGGLEYLFGVWYYDKGESKFQSFWAHTRAEEKIAFEGFIDFAAGRLSLFPNAHIYHYASYEQTALKKLMCLHGTREAVVDNLLRLGKLVDLYQVVRESIRVSEPSYSIKNIERFYLDKRTGEVKNAGASVVHYEKWKETGDSKLLEEIEEYNREDVRSTCELHKWLLKMRPKDLPWFKQEGEEEKKEAGLTEAEKKLIPYRENLVDSLPEDRSLWGAGEHHRELCYQLLDFHRRADKPQWWAMFDRRDMTKEERFEDPECIAALTKDPKNPPIPVKRSFRYTYIYPEQETKLKIGDSCVHIDTTKSLSDFTIDEEERRVSFKVGANSPQPQGVFDIGLGGPINSKVIKEAVFRYADSLIGEFTNKKPSRYLAIDRFLRREIPAIAHISSGQPIINEQNPVVEEQIVHAVAELQESYMFIQGPPGAGKTHTGSRVIVELLKQGKRVGVSSNSHKAIINLLKAVEKHAIESNVKFRGAKKSTDNDDSSHIKGKMIVDVFDNDAIIGGKFQLIAGTAWLFSRPEMDKILDYIFIDEAGQIALANLVALGTSARNIVLLGDQMQLSQPVQGVHPGLSGESSLDYLLEGRATIPPDRGILSPVS